MKYKPKNENNTQNIIDIDPKILKIFYKTRYLLGITDEEVNYLILNIGTIFIDEDKFKLFYKKYGTNFNKEIELILKFINKDNLIKEEIYGIVHGALKATIKKTKKSYDYFIDVKKIPKAKEVMNFVQILNTLTNSITNGRNFNNSENLRIIKLMHDFLEESTWTKDIINADQAKILLNNTKEILNLSENSGEQTKIAFESIFGNDPKGLQDILKNIIDYTSSRKAGKLYKSYTDLIKFAQQPMFISVYKNIFNKIKSCISKDNILTEENIRDNIIKLHENIKEKSNLNISSKNAQIANLRRDTEIQNQDFIKPDIENLLINLIDESQFQKANQIEGISILKTTINQAIAHLEEERKIPTAIQRTLANKNLLHNKKLQSSNIDSWSDQILAEINRNVNLKTIG